jgi:hypothetical protein
MGDRTRVQQNSRAIHEAIKATKPLINMLRGEPPYMPVDPLHPTGG